MNHLLRSHAPITDTAWSRLDAEGRERLVPALGARKLVDFSGPLGWGHSATNLGRVSEVRAPGENCRRASAGSCRSSSCGLPSRSCHVL